MTRNRFEDQVVVVTGAGGGIGRALARGYAREGAQLVLAGRTEATLAGAAEAVAEAGSEALVCTTDVSREEDCIRLVAKTLERFGRLDVLINNAGAPGTDQTVAEMTLENWNQTIATNVTGPMLLTREALRRAMIPARRGNVQFSSSAAAKRVRPRKAHYAVAKMGLLSLTQTLALEVSEYGIRVNALVIGLVGGELVDAWVRRTAVRTGRSEEKIRRSLVADIPLGRPIDAREVVDVSMYLASEEASALTGQSINVSGGYEMR